MQMHKQSESIRQCNNFFYIFRRCAEHSSAEQIAKTARMKNKLQRPVCFQYNTMNNLDGLSQSALDLLHEAA